jgi:hypothetical protein
MKWDAPHPILSLIALPTIDTVTTDQISDRKKQVMYSSLHSLLRTSNQSELDKDRQTIETRSPRPAKIPFPFHLLYL